MTISIDDYRDTLNASMSEAQLQALVVDAAQKLGFLCYHTWNSQHSEAGFPDLVLAKSEGQFSSQDGRLIFAELKSQKGRMRPEQRRWIEILSSGRLVNTMLGWHEAFEVYTWRPEDWNSGDIIRILKGDVS